MNDQEVWLALDVGSSAVKAWAFADGGRALARASAPVATEYPAPGLSLTRIATYLQFGRGKLGRSPSHGLGRRFL